MPSFEEEDERISTQRAVRRRLQASEQPPSNSQRLPTRVAAVRRAPSPVVEAQDFYGNPAVEDENEAEDGENDVLVTPEPTRKTQKRRATASVSFSEPVETPQRPIQPPSQKESNVGAPRGRNRLETRLAELQRDVANLSLRLRASSTQSQRALSMDDDEDEENDREVTGTSLYSTDDSRLTHRAKRQPEETNHAAPAAPLRAKSPARTILKTSKTVTEPRRVPGKSPSRVSSRQRELDSREGEEVELRIHRERGLQPQQEQEPPPRSTREMLRAVRDLRVVAVERDQLRFELEQTRKALVAMEKKYTEAVKWKAAYDKMKAHCDSLQESLDLSEKIRVRQKKLLQQLQQSAKQREDAARRTAGHAAAQRVDVLDSILNPPSREPSGYQSQVQTQQLKRRATGEADATRTRATRAAPTRGASSSRPVTATAMNTSASRSFSRSDFDSLLQIPLRDRSMAGSTTLYQQRSAGRPNDSRLPATASRPPRTSSTQPVATRVSKTARPAGPSAPRTNHFLAPTQASLNHAAKRKTEGIRRPFVV